MHFCSRAALGLVLGLAPSSAASLAQDAPAAPGLADLARCFLRFEEALAAEPPSDAERSRVELAFDQATRRFFFADLRGALRDIDELYADRLPAQEGRDDALALCALRIELEPAIVPWREARSVELHLRSLYEPELEEEGEREAQLVLRRADGAVLARTTATLAELEPTDRRLRLELSQPLEGPAACWIELADATGRVHARARWSAVAEDLTVLTQRALAAADEIERERPELARALRSFRARCTLLAGLADPKRAALAPLDPVQLSAEIARELATLREGRDPYRGRTGELWRVFELAGREVPLRLYVPDARPDAAQRESPPLVVALHGAGGNEHLFFDAYGRGLLRRLAEECGFVLACPSTYPFARDPAAIEALQDELARDVAFDPARVFVIGHSLGAMAAARIAHERGARVAKVCCLAGAGDLGTAVEIPPVLAILAELDAIVPAGPVTRGLERARAAGLPVELRILDGRAHTLMVPDALRIALDWLGLGADRTREQALPAAPPK